MGLVSKLCEYAMKENHFRQFIRHMKNNESLWCGRVARVY